MSVSLAIRRTLFSVPFLKKNIVNEFIYKRIITSTSSLKITLYVIKRTKFAYVSFFPFPPFWNFFKKVFPKKYKVRPTRKTPLKLSDTYNNVASEKKEHER